MSRPALPFGHNSVNPYLIVPDIGGQIEFLKRVFGGVELDRMQSEDGNFGHAEVLVGNSLIMMGQSSAQWPPQPAGLYVYVDDTDGAYARALAAGAVSVMEPADQFYGHRNAGVRDQNGNTWWIATYLEEVSPEEVRRRAAEAGRL